jgi:hypothetical protein
MKRKLISFDVFKKIEEGSISTAQHELAGAEEVLSKTLGVDELRLHCFGESDVTYQSLDGSFVHANYKINKNQLVLENIESLVIEEETEKKKARDVLTSMVESLLDNNEAKASEQFENYLSLPVVRRDLIVSEAFDVSVSKPSGKHSSLYGKKQDRGLVAKRIREMKKTKKKLTAAPSLRASVAKKRANAAKKLGGANNPRWRTYARKVKPTTMKEWSVMCEHIMDYLDYKEFGPTIKESLVQNDEKGNVVAVAMPTIQKRNEGKILSFNWKTLDHEVKTQRAKIKRLAEDTNFCKAMADLKRYNNISDNTALEETLEKIVSMWPDVLYLTQTELAEQIGAALETAAVKNYDDQTCEFMAEGILRMAHHAYTDRVRKISSMAGVSPEATTESTEEKDAYANFAKVCADFYPQLDESDQAELRVFADLYKALHEVFRIASETGDEATRSEVASYLNNCEAILNRESQPDLSLAETIANYLYDLAEANVEGAKDTWDVSNSDVHTTVSGDHPRMSWAAKVTNAVPSNFPGDWGGKAPVSDGKSYRNGLEDEMRSRSWSQYASGETYPDLKNPYVPKSPWDVGNYKMKGEESAATAGTSDWSRWQSKDTWPNLQNPYVPDSPWDKSKYKATIDKGNLVVDKGETKQGSVKNHF